MQIKVVERTQEIHVQEQEMLRRERELEATVKRPAEAEKFRLEKLAEGLGNYFYYIYFFIPFRIWFLSPIN